ncbi:MAG: sulfite exporter TauE/SafE family protein [Syntrophales bacterium]
MDITTVTVLAILFVSSLVRAIFGFGNALIAMPLLAMTSLGMQAATPIVALIATVMSFVIIVKDWRIIDLRSTWRLLAATVFGIPLGLLLLTGPFEKAGKILLAVVIVGFSLYSLLRPKLAALTQEWTAYPFGFIAGILGSAYNSNGPPIVIYGTVRRWSPDRFRANLQGYFFPANLIIIAGHAMGGLWTPTVGWYFLISLPIIFLSILLGNVLNRLIPQGQFDRLVHIVLVMIGTLLFVRTIAA